MHIGIIGTGTLGQALATGFDEAGHEVVVGSRDPAAHSLEGISTESQSAAVEHGQVVLLAVPPEVAVPFTRDHADQLAGRVVVDPTNEYPKPSSDPSIVERIADAAPDATVVKAFDTIGANRMTAPVIDGAAVTMFIAGDDHDATNTVATLAEDLGFEPVVLDSLDWATHLDELSRFWIALSQEFGRDVGFHLHRE